MEERLKKFARLVDAGSFTKAAAELHLSQPALSTAIAKLERELKTRLLVRGSRPLALTPAGELAYQAAKALSVQTDNLKSRLAELANEQQELKIGMIDSIADLLFGSGIGLELVKDAQISLVVNNSRYLAEAVERGEVDMALIAKGRSDLPAILEALPVADEPLAVVCHPGMYATASGSLPDFIAYDKPSNTFKLVQEALKRYGVTPEVVFYSTSPDVTLRLVLQNKGAAALPYLLVREHLDTGRLQRLGGKQPWLIPRQIVALRRRDKELPASLRRLADQTARILDALMNESSK